MIEDLLYRIQSSVDVATAEEAIARLPAEYGVVLDLHYAWGLSRREIAALLGWSQGKVSQRLTRAITLLKYELHPEAFSNAEAILQRPMQFTK
jgi:RNA polymerase sigma factor (sigma-70 family)